MESECKVFSDGSKEWRLNGWLHREGGPAIEYPNGTKYWYLNGKPHREGGLPAVEGADGTKYWYLKGNLHREGGPAIEWANGTTEWYLNGIQYETPDKMPLSLFLAYVKWKKDHERV